MKYLEKSIKIKGNILKAFHELLEECK